jgi:hypothetical protein
LKNRPFPEQMGSLSFCMHESKMTGCIVVLARKEGLFPAKNDCGLTPPPRHPDWKAFFHHPAEKCPRPARSSGILRAAYTTFPGGERRFFRIPAAGNGGRIPVAAPCRAPGRPNAARDARVPPGWTRESPAAPASAAHHGRNWAIRAQRPGQCPCFRLQHPGIMSEYSSSRASFPGMLVVKSWSVSVSRKPGACDEHLPFGVRPYTAVPAAHREAGAAAAVPGMPHAPTGRARAIWSCGVHAGPAGAGRAVTSSGSGG